MYNANAVHYTPLLPEPYRRLPPTTPILKQTATPEEVTCATCAGMMHRLGKAKDGKNG